MRFVILWLVVLGLIVAVPTVVEGIRTNDPGFWMLVGFLVVIAIAIHWKMKRLAEDPPSKRPLRSPGER